MNKSIENQIDLNLELELLIYQFKDFERREKRNIGFLNNTINMYQRKIDKSSSLETTSNILENRKNIYIETCKKMIESIKSQIKIKEELINNAYENLKNNIWSKLQDNFYGGNIDNETIIEKDFYYLYLLPSAKLIFEKQLVKIEDEKELKSFLYSNNLFEYYNNEDIDIEKLENDMEISDDGSIIHTDTGLLVDGISLTDCNLQIKFL
jgi:hypothetical protein